MTPSLITQGEELLKKVAPEKWEVSANATHDEWYGTVKSFTTHTAIWGGKNSWSDEAENEAQLVCWLVNHASELLQMAREVERLKVRTEVMENPLPTQEEEREFYHRAYHVCHTGCPMPCPNRT